MIIKDSVNREFTSGRLILRACDCDENGNIENIDIIVDGKQKYCINIKEFDGDTKDYQDALATVFEALTKE